MSASEETKKERDLQKIARGGKSTDTKSVRLVRGEYGRKGRELGQDRELGWTSRCPQIDYFLQREGGLGLSSGLHDSEHFYEEWTKRL